MSESSATEVVILGGGIVGCTTAYYLAKEGIRATIIERDTVAGHSSGFALGGLSPLGGVGIPDPLGQLSVESFRLHADLARALPDETGVDTEYALETGVTVAYSEAEAAAMQERLPWQQAQEGFRVEWKGGEDILALEPRLAPGVVGGVVTQHVAMLDPYRHTLALLQAAEGSGATMRHGTVLGLGFDGDRLRSVRLSSGEIPCERVVVAMGAWTVHASDWLGIDLPVRPLKGQILRLQVDGPPITHVSWGPSYAVTKPDDLVWVGTTEEDAGYDEAPTAEGRQAIMESVLRALPYLTDGRVVQHTACLRPVTADGLPILGQVPGKPEVIVATGGGRKGIHLSAVMGRIAADLLVRGQTRYDISALKPGRAISESVARASESDPFRF
jgi:glycine oxidase